MFWLISLTRKLKTIFQTNPELGLTITMKIEIVIKFCKCYVIMRSSSNLYSVIK